MTLNEAKEHLRLHGVVLTKREGEYRVNLKGGTEETAYYTDDLQDALDTGRAMAGSRSPSEGRSRDWPEELEALIGYDGQPYYVGDRVELHPGLDMWMRGARYGEVVGVSLTPQDRVRVSLDRFPDRLFAGPEDRFRKIT